MTPPDQINDQLAAAIEDYLTRLDDHTAPDREEFIAKYPQCAAGLRDFFENLQLLETRLAEDEAADNRKGVDKWTADAGDTNTVAGFKLLAELGCGSQGIIYKAEQFRPRRIVALKVIREGALASAAERRRFENEIELGSLLHHPNIVSILECRQDRGRPYFAMEYVDGPPLDLYCSQNALNPQATARLILLVCKAVAYAHQRGVIHRDLKPSNILVDSAGQPHILDFGLAKPVPDGNPIASSVTLVGEFAGTWFYASPEQVRRDPALVDVRTDVYAIGVILFQMLTKQYPYPVENETGDAVARHILETPPARPSAIRREIDVDLETIILRTLSKEPQRRYQSAAALAEDLGHYLAGEAIDARRDEVGYVLRQLLRRHRWKVAAAGAALLILIAFTVTISILYSQATIAGATTNVRMAVVRDAQWHTLESLDELHRAVNALESVAQTHPNLPAVQRFLRPPGQDLPAFVSELAAAGPDGIVEAITARDEPSHRTAVQWLEANEARLAEAVAHVQANGFASKMVEADDSHLSFSTVPVGLIEAGRIGSAFVARALHRSAAGDSVAAIDSLNAARRIALDLGDGRLFMQKTFSVMMRDQAYDAVLHILGSVADRADLDLYLDWVAADPPLPKVGISMSSERLKLAQFVEGASTAHRTDAEGHLDLDILNTLSDGLYADCGELTDHRRTLARSLAPRQALSCIDAYVSEVEQWDDLSFSQITERHKKLFDRLHSDPAWSVLYILFDSHESGFRSQRRCHAKRVATVVATHLCRFYAAHRRWPDSLEEIYQASGLPGAADPYIGVPFGYHVDGKRVTLYSVNEDGIDNGGVSGAWGQPDSDVVFLNAAR